jgi:hypothetical protein
MLVFWPYKIDKRTTDLRTRASAVNVCWMQKVLTTLNISQSTIDNITSKMRIHFKNKQNKKMTSKCIESILAGLYQRKFDTAHYKKEKKMGGGGCAGLLLKMHFGRLSRPMYLPKTVWY